MEHALILGGEHWLPFARSRLRALSRLGLAYASQRFEMPDSMLVKVRKVQDQKFIKIDGSGGWLAYCMRVDLTTSTANIKRVFDTTVSFTPQTYPDPPVAPSYQHNAVEPQGNGSKLGSDFAWVYMNRTIYPAAVWHDLYNPGDSVVAGMDNYPNPGEWQSIRDWIFQYLIDHPPPSGENVTVAQSNAWSHKKFDAWNGEVAANIAWSASENTRFLAEQAADGAVNGPIRAAYNANTYNYYSITLPAIDVANAAGYAAAVAAVEATKRSLRISERPLQMQKILDEMDRGALTPWVSYDIFPPPINPRVVHALPFPVTTNSRVDGGLGAITYTYTLADNTVSPLATRDVAGTNTNILMGGTEETCGATYNRNSFVSVNMVSADVITDLKYMVNPGTSFGYFVDGYSERLEGDIRVTATYTIPPEYLAYLKTRMVSAPIAAEVASDVYVPVGTTLTLVHLEWETFDIFTGVWTWMAAPRLSRIDPLYLCGDSQASGPDPTVRAVRLRKITVQTLGVGRVWSAPTPVLINPAPSFNHVVLAHSSPSFPPAVAILQKLPSATVPPRPGGSHDGETVYAARIAASSDLRSALQTDWTGDPSAPGWYDRLVMEALSIVGTYRRAST